MKRNKINSRKGFTLVEMLGVLAIIAILISVISVGVLSAINRARIVSTVSNFKNLETAILAYVALPESSGQLPLTKSSASIPSVSNMLQNAAAGANFAAGAQNALHLEPIFLAAGTLERYPQWRAGRDGMQSGMVNLSEENGWNRKKGRWADTNSAGAAIGTANAWNEYVRAECAPVAQAAIPGTSTVGSGAMMNADGVNFHLDGTSDLPTSTRCAYVVIPGLSLKDAEKLSEEINGALNVMDLNAPTASQVQAAGRFVTDAVDHDGTVTAYYFLANL